MSVLNKFLQSSGRTLNSSNAQEITKEFFLCTSSYQDKVTFIEDVSQSLIQILKNKTLSVDERISSAENTEIFLSFLASFHSVNSKESQYMLRLALFNYFIQGGDIINYSQGAEILSNASLEGISLTSNQKVDHYLKCAGKPSKTTNILLLFHTFFLEAFLLDNVISSAETCARKANNFLSDIESTPEGSALSLRLRVTLARVMDYNRKFSEASSRFYELSNTTNVKVSRQRIKLPNSS